MEIFPLDLVSVATEGDPVQKAESDERPLSTHDEGTCKATEQPAASEARTDKMFIDEIADAAEDIWSRLSSAMKSKVREACQEVLRRTDEHSSRQQDDFSFDYDDDARFLD
ncbi:hypothetical protein AC578_411 [Pseudocercospora eumusae]|uniref:Uncharacterized protein n=1 Tax=Pseudocercospora eumusae TaxID=321146 RepID=A0A139HY66_9PEZI|nr:hypothetical protein AC578_411 [Pseudocercospora eumusae]